MNIYPAIDILEAKAVRLLKGDYKKVTVYGKPHEVAKRWCEQGAEAIHIVDLDGARGDKGNVEVIGAIVKSESCFVQVGGGIRSLEQARGYLDTGVDQVIIGTAAVKDQDFLRKLVETYPDRITVGVDAKDGFVAIDGWLEKTTLNADVFIKQLSDMGIKRVVYTDISKDGTLTGPNFRMYEKILDETDIEIIASGGISEKEDLIKLKEIGVHGVVVGKALYEERFTLKEVLCLQGE